MRVASQCNGESCSPAACPPAPIVLKDTRGVAHGNAMETSSIRAPDSSDGTMSQKRANLLQWRMPRSTCCLGRLVCPFNPNYVMGLGFGNGECRRTFCTRIQGLSAKLNVHLGSVRVPCSAMEGARDPEKI